MLGAIIEHGWRSLLSVEAVKLNNLGAGNVKMIQHKSENRCVKLQPQSEFTP